jgi:hypothetical protein
MIKKWLALLQMLLSLAAFGQTGFTVKLYSHASLFDARTILGYDENSGAVVAFDGLAPAVMIQSENGLYQEVELSRLYYKNVDNGAEPYEKGSMSLRYEAGFSKLKNSNSKMRLRYGLSLRGYLFNYSNYTGGFQGYPIDRDGIGWILSFTPHLEVNFTRRLFFDFSPYLDLANLGIRREFEYNPDFEDEQVDSIDFLFSSFRPRLRAGFGWHF